MKEFAKIYNSNYDIVTSLEEKITKHGCLDVNKDGSNNAIEKEIENKLNGFNMISLFSLAKTKQKMAEYEPKDKNNVPAEDFTKDKNKIET